MRASDLLESYVSKLLSLYRDASAELSKSTSCLDQLEKSLSGTEEKVSPEQLAFKREDMDILTSSIEKAETVITVDIPRAYRPIGQRMAVLSSTGFLKESDDLQDLDKKLKAVQAGLVEQMKWFTAKFEEIGKNIQTNEAQMA